MLLASTLLLPLDIGPRWELNDTSLMKKKLTTKIGDVFSVPISETEKRYMQLIAFDDLQLNSDVIRCFAKIYNVNDMPEIVDIISADVLFAAHCATDFGLKLKLWSRVGNIGNIGKLDGLLFKSTDDYARKAGEAPVLISDNWHVWSLFDKKFRKVGKLHGIYHNAFNGLIFNPYGILELAKGNEYPLNYPK
jgi:hypothetical protein